MNGAVYRYCTGGSKEHHSTFTSSIVDGSSWSYPSVWIEVLRGIDCDIGIVRDSL